MSKKETLSFDAFKANFTTALAAKEGQEAANGVVNRGAIAMAFKSGQTPEEAAADAAEQWEEMHAKHVSDGGANLNEDGDDSAFATFLACLSAGDDDQRSQN